MVFEITPYPTTAEDTSHWVGHPLNGLPVLWVKLFGIIAAFFMNALGVAAMQSQAVQDMTPSPVNLKTLMENGGHRPLTATV